MQRWLCGSILSAVGQGTPPNSLRDLWNGARIRKALTQPGSGEVPQRFLSPEGICQLLSISSRTLRRWVRAGVFPAPLRVGPYKATPRWSPLVLTDFLLSKHPPRQAEELCTKGCGDATPAQTGAAAAASIAGIVQGGVIVPDAPLPEGMRGPYPTGGFVLDLDGSGRH